MYKKFTSYIVVFIAISVLSGCNKAVKSGLNNFSAYYNTYYNAQKQFKEGEEKVKNQNREINPERPVSIFLEPLTAGKQNFEVAIDKGADILRKYPESKWVDDALLLIGRSYFYLQQYFDANQKFDEILNTSKNASIRMEAIFWKGRVLLEMEQYQESLAYITGALQKDEINWDHEKKARVQALAGQLHTTLEHWEQARGFLSDALEELPGGNMRARAYFLYGQVLERLDQPDLAFNAYKNVEKEHPKYAWVYQAQRKQAEIARNTGQYNRAYAIFEQMSKDDKNFEIQPQLIYEMAKTLQEKGAYSEAQSLYNQVLHHSINTPDNVTKAKSYYGIAEIYRYHYQNYRKASAYYDSARSQRADIKKLPEDFNAQTMASVFGKYADLSQQAHLTDSLLWLGSLSPNRLDSVVAKIREQKIEQLKKQQKQQQKNANTALVSNRAQANNRQATTTANASGRRSFLNYKNMDLVQQARQNFIAQWGNRPLVDNWRRMSAIRAANQADESIKSANANNEGIGSIRVENQQQVRVDLSQVPFTKTERDKKREELAGLHYELGNLFFLSLNQPDSASYHYKKIINDFENTTFRARAMYSLSELQYVNNNNDEARKWAMNLINTYPDSRFAYRLRQRYDIDPENRKEDFIEKDSALVAYQKVLDTLADASPWETAKAKLAFYRKKPENTYADEALFSAIQQFVLAGRQDTANARLIEQWYQLQQKWASEKEAFGVLKDSAKTIISNKSDSLSENRLEYWQKVADSTYKKPDKFKYFPYKGAYWDSARTAIKLFVNNFDNHSNIEQVKILKKELELPEPNPQKPTPDTTANDKGQNEGGIPPDSIRKTKAEADAAADSIYACHELNIRPEVIGSREAFFDSIEFPSDIQALSMAGALPYMVLINKQGGVEEVSFLGANSGTGLENIVKDAMLESLRFKPVMHNGEPVRARCRVAIPVKL